MKKYRNALLCVLAFNSVGFTYSEPTAVNNVTENLYNQMIENIKTGKSNDSNYKQIEKILNQF